MKNILLFLILLAPLLGISQDIPNGVLRGNTNSVTSLGNGKYQVDVTTVSGSGLSNAFSLNDETEEWVFWKNCKRYTVDSVFNAGLSGVNLRIVDVHNNGTPLSGANTSLINETRIGTGGFIAGLTDGDNECINQYYISKAAESIAGTILVRDTTHNFTEGQVIQYDGTWQAASQITIAVSGKKGNLGIILETTSQDYLVAVGDGIYTFDSFTLTDSEEYYLAATSGNMITIPPSNESDIHFLGTGFGTNGIIWSPHNVGKDVTATITRTITQNSHGLDTLDWIHSVNGTWVKSLASPIGGAIAVVVGVIDANTFILQDRGFVNFGKSHNIPIDSFGTLSTVIPGLAVEGIISDTTLVVFKATSTTEGYLFPPLVFTTDDTPVTSTLNKLDIPTLSYNLGQVLFTQDNEKYIVQADSLEGYTNDSIAVIKTANNNYAILEEYELETFGFNLDDLDSDHTAQQKLIEFQFYKTGGKLYSQEYKEGIVQVDTTLFTGLNFDKVEIIGNGVEFRWSKDVIYNFKIFDITSDDVIIENVEINSMFDEQEVSVGSNISPTLGGWTATNNSSISGDTLYLNSGVAEARYSYSLAVGDAFQVEVTAASINGTVTFGVEDNPTVSLTEGVNSFLYTVTNTPVPGRFELTANSVNSGVITDIKIFPATLKDIVDVNNANVVSAIDIKTKNNIEGSKVIIRESKITTGENAIRILEGASRGYKLVLIENNDLYSRRGVDVAGDHKKVTITGNLCDKVRRWDNQDGVKSISVSGGEILSYSDVSITNNTVQYGGDGSAYFLSGRGIRNFVMDGNSVFHFNYYLDATGNQVAYTNSDHSGGNLFKIDPVFFNPEQTYIVSNFTVSGTNDTIDIFQPFNLANGTVNFRLINSNLDVGDFTQATNETSGTGNGIGSLAGRLHVENCNFRVKSAFEVPSFPKYSVIENCNIYSDIVVAGTTGDSLVFARVDEFADSLEVENVYIAKCNSCDIKNLNIYGLSMEISGGEVNIDNMIMRGPGNLILKPDNTFPHTDTINWNLSNFDGKLRISFRDTLGNFGTEDVNTFFNISDSFISFTTVSGISGDTKNYVTTLPNLMLDNVYEVNRYIEKAPNSINYFYKKGLSRTPLFINKPVLHESYSTAARNALIGVRAGRVVFDSDLSKLVLYNGTNWVNLDGTSL